MGVGIGAFVFKKKYFILFPLVRRTPLPGKFEIRSIRQKEETLEETPVCENLFPPIFWHN